LRESYERHKHYIFSAGGKYKNKIKLRVGTVENFEMRLITVNVILAAPIFKELRVTAVPATH
jgi:hypothetical protein